MALTSAGKSDIHAPVLERSGLRAMKARQVRVLRVINRNVSYKAVHATRGKVVRAGPISTLYELKKVHHVGVFPALETQMCSFVPDQLSMPINFSLFIRVFLSVGREPTPQAYA